MKGAAAIADFDSATAMLRALSNYLKGEDFPLLGAMPRSRAALMRIAAAAVNRMPERWREQVYIWSGRLEAIAPGKLGVIDMERVSEWLCGMYPQRRYSAVAIGSSNGAATHLWAALGIPWLPQTLLIPVARSGDPDDAAADAWWAKDAAAGLLQSNPEIELHHMHDPVQDRLMLRRMTYFRVKRLRLGRAYENFLRQTLEPGGTIILVDCGLRWPTTSCGERHFFQFGAPGGATREEYFGGGPRVAEYLRRYHSQRRRWDPPEPNGERPEAEWGFEPYLREDIEAFALRHGYTIKRLSFDFPEHLSRFAADFYRQWNRRRGIHENRLIVDSFIIMEPYWTVRTGSIPFWMLFNTEGSAAALSRYLETTQFDEAYLMLFSHGVDSIGVVPIEQWHRILKRARRCALIGINERAYPRDFAAFVRYHDDLIAKISPRYTIPAPLELVDLENFVRERRDDTAGVQFH